MVVWDTGGQRLDETLHIIAIWAHILGIALFVGGQFFLAFAWVPTSRTIADTPTRLRAMRSITRRFAWLAGTGLVIIILAGSYLISDWRDYWGIPDEAGFTDLRYGVIFIIKMTLFLVVLAAVGAHSFVVGPRLLDTLEARERGEGVLEEDVRRLRMWSMALSITGLVLALAMMVLGVMLGTGEFSLEEV